MRVAERPGENALGDSPGQRRVVKRDPADRRAEPASQLGGRSLRDLAALAQDDDVVGQALRLIKVLRREQDGNALAPQLLDHLPQLPARQRVEARRGLIEEQQLRFDDQRGRDVEPPPHAPGVLGRALVARIREPEPVQQLIRALGGSGPPEAVEAREEDEVLLAGQLPVNGGELTGQGDVPAHLSGLGHDIRTAHGDRPRGGLHQCGGDIHQRRLAGAIGSQQRDHLSGADVEAEALEHFLGLGAFAEGLAEIAHAQRDFIR